MHKNSQNCTKDSSQRELFDSDSVLRGGNCWPDIWLFSHMQMVSVSTYVHWRLKKIPCSLLPKYLLLHCSWGLSFYYVDGNFLYLVSWWCDKAISHLFLVKLLYKLGLDFSHIISQKHSRDFNLSQHKCQCYMFFFLKWAVAVEEIEKEKEIIITTARMAWYCVVHTTTLLTPSFILYWLLALGIDRKSVV